MVSGRSQLRHGVGWVLENVLLALSVPSHIRSIKQEGKPKTKNKNIEINSGENKNALGLHRLVLLVELLGCGCVGRRVCSYLLFL